ncbi:hypothetical protein NDN01_18725 [Sphingomonas sp. QA11]|uniref:hypothetical protein n=1 Tax=Sphingomonas sp. QA11 TaxID=2950605 RepID=UPI002349081E|nr:hypothetical protein [Sphingomonas sp. QA11]WCM26031.1 hypothetical protein NDN01_18725 [Sphingomonas sp. QA11]
MSEHPSGLDNPEQAAFAWRRYRRLLGWMTLFSLFCGLAAVFGLQHFYGPLSWIAILAAIGGIGGSVLMASALMGLVFLSSGTGHDEAVDARDPEKPGPRHDRP